MQDLTAGEAFQSSLSLEPVAVALIQVPLCFSFRATGIAEPFVAVDELDVGPKKGLAPTSARLLLSRAGLKAK